MQRAYPSQSSAVREPCSTGSHSLLVRLRAATARQHAQLDAQLSHALASLTTDRYGAFLLASYAAVEPLESAVAALLGHDGSWPRRTSLRADLTALGLQVTAVAAAPDCQLPASIGEALGCAYVLEGSALGGVVLATRLGTTGRGASAYLRLRGPDTPLAWRSFLARLAAYDSTASEHDRERACTAARAAFDTYAGCFAAAGLGPSPCNL